MLINFFFMLRSAGVPVSLTEFLSLMDGLDARLTEYNIDNFYFLSRTALVKDERYFDRFDRVFGAHFEGIEAAFTEIAGAVPEEWLRRQAELELSEEEKRRIKSLGGWEKLMQALRERLAAQKGRHQGGSKWIGTGGTSPFGAYGYNPEGVRIGQGRSRHRRAVKVWDRRDYRNLDDSVQLGTRNIKLALRRLREFARQGAAEELDLDKTVGATARNAGLLEIHMVPERHNAAKVLLFLDVGGSMDDHTRICEELFSAAHTEFRHLTHYYFHNFIYEYVWKDNRRRHTERIPTMDVIHTYGRDHKLVFVGDATMSPYEIMAAGGGVEHWNVEPGHIWIRRLLKSYPKAVWLNPEPVTNWDHTQSIQITRRLVEDRMFPLTIEGIDRGMRALM